MGPLQLGSDDHNLAVLMFSTCFFSISGIVKAATHNFMKCRSRDGLAAKGLLGFEFLVRS